MIEKEVMKAQADEVYRRADAINKIRTKRKFKEMIKSGIKYKQ
jgi:hypothetical protein